MIFQEIESRFSILDDIPASIYTELVTHTHGELIPRVTAILHWRESMLAGELPIESKLIWPEKSIKRTILMRLETLDIVQYCKNQETLTDNIVRDILEGISSAEEYYSHKTDGFIDKLAQRQKINHKNSSFKDEEGLADHVQSNDPEQQETTSQKKPQSTPKSKQQNTGQQTATESSNNTTNSNVVSNHQLGNSAIPEPDNHLKTESPSSQNEKNIAIDHLATEQLEQNWQELAASWHELSSTYSEFNTLLGQGWDLSQGILAAEGWRDIIRYRKLIKQLPELTQLISTLGRLREVVGEQQLSSLTEQVFNPILRQTTDERETWTDKASMETGGIVLSDDLSRILPSELALLGHPKLKMLWYAKRAERKLLTYCHCGLLPDPTLVDKQVEIEGPPQQEQSSQAFGPIIICLDTSASMQGEPENIAKALTLEALRIAFNEQRPCFIYAFGGEKQVLEHDLDLTQGGLIKLLAFLKQSFHGGTDVIHPLLLALDKQKKHDWKNADILLISDGRFPVQAHLFNKVVKLKKHQSLRLHGLSLGNWNSTAMSQLCDPMHNYNQWNLNSN